MPTQTTPQSQSQYQSQSQIIDNGFLLNTVLELVEVMLNQQEYYPNNSPTPEYIRAIKITDNYIKLYRNPDTDPAKESTNLILNLVEGQGQVNSQNILTFLQYSRRIKMFNYSKYPDQPQRYYSVAHVYNNTIQTASEQQVYNAYGVMVDIIHELFYVDDSPRAQQDPRPLLMKMAKYRFMGVEDRMIYLLLQNNLHSGIIRNMANDPTYLAKLPHSPNTYTKLDSESAWKKHTRLLEYQLSKESKEAITQIGQENNIVFSSFGYNIAKTQFGNGGMKVSLPQINPVNLPPNLLVNLTAPKGIILLDKLVASDLLTAPAIKEAGYLDILLTSSAGRTQMYQTIELVDPQSNQDVKRMVEFNKVSDQTALELARSGYQIIIDNANLLTADQQIEMSKHCLLICSGDISNLQTYFQESFDITSQASTSAIYNRFINSLLYIGSLPLSTGYSINPSLRQLLLQQEFSLFEHHLQPNPNLQNMLNNQLAELKQVGDVDSIIIQPEQVIANIVLDKQLQPARMHRFTNPSQFELVRFLSEATNNPQEVFNNIIKNGYATTSTTLQDNTYKLTSYRDGQNTLTINIIKALQPQAIKLQEKLNQVGISNKVLQSEGPIINIHGLAKSGKSTLLKSALPLLPPHSTLYILDPEYSFIEKEPDLSNHYYHIERMSLDLNKIAILEPNYILINTEIDLQQLKDLLYSSPRSRAILFCSNIQYQAYTASTKAPTPATFTSPLHEDIYLYLSQKQYYTISAQDSAPTTASFKKLY